MPKAKAPLEFASLLEISERIAARDISSAEVTRYMLDRADRLQPRFHAFAHICSKTALADAERADREIEAGQHRGPLHGVPVAVKDLLSTRDHPTASGMRIFADWYAEEDATAVARLKQAGAVIIAKAQMTEGATAAHHPDVTAPVNPWTADRSAGASSSGSGVCVAAGLSYAALGSDTGGSIRLPSAMNGTTGLKPSWGRVSRHGVFPLVEYLDTVGPMTRNAADAAAVLHAIAGADPKDVTAAPAAVPDYLSTIGNGIRNIVIGYDAAAVARICDDEIASIVDNAARVLGELGAEIRPISLPDLDMREMFPLINAGVRHTHRDTYPMRADDYGPGLRSMLDMGAALDGTDVSAAINRAVQLRGSLAMLFEDIDLLLIPALTGPTPKVGVLEQGMATDPEGVIRMTCFTAPFNISGQPTITLRGGTDSNGMPAAFQLVGRLFDEELLLRAGHSFQQATDWHRHHPTLE